MPYVLEQGFSVMTQHLPTLDSALPALRFAQQKFGSEFDESNVPFTLTFPSQHLVKTGGTTNVMVCLHEIIDPW